MVLCQRTPPEAGRRSTHFPLRPSNRWPSRTRGGGRKATEGFPCQFHLNFIFILFSFYSFILISISRVSRYLSGPVWADMAHAYQPSPMLFLLPILTRSPHLTLPDIFAARGPCLNSPPPVQKKVRPPRGFPGMSVVALCKGPRGQPAPFPTPRKPSKNSFFHHCEAKFGVGQPFFRLS